MDKTIKDILVEATSIFADSEFENEINISLNEIEAIMQGVIGEDLPIKARQSGELNIHNLTINLNKIEQRQALQTALYGKGDRSI